MFMFIGFCVKMHSIKLLVSDLAMLSYGGLVVYFFVIYSIICPYLNYQLDSTSEPCFFFTFLTFI